MQNSEDLSELQKQISFFENKLSLSLSKEALTRYYTVKSINPEFALKVCIFLNQTITQKYINQKLDDTQFKIILKQLQDSKKEFKIKL